ncbi:tetratricopeptide repeat protein [Aquimarina algiphila]|uniref:tetratricopeptide repeat protein n=1 Tax=Aquimarina algiphila TaxID=2047982 RepID=UPI002490812F|nr:tetratricopeptide repeat protein [Aquimarina algiphila]
MKKYPSYCCSIIFLWITITMYSQEKDTLLLRLQQEVEYADKDVEKIDALLLLGNYQISRDFSKAERYLLEALELIKKNPEHKQLQHYATVYEALGIVHKRKGNYPEAVDSYLKSKTFYEKLNDSSNIADIYHNMAMVYRDQKDYKKAIDYFKRAIIIKDLLQEDLGVAIGYNMLGVAYRQAKQMDSAFYCYQVAKKSFNTLKDKENIYRVNSNLAAWYHTKKDYEKAIPIYLENLAYDIKTNQKLSQQRANYNIAGSYMQLKEYETALTYVNEALIIAKEQDAKSRISKSYLRRSFLKKKLKDYEKALEDYRMYKKYSDSVFNIENVKKIQALELTHKFNQEKLADSLQFSKEKREFELITEAESSKKQMYFILLMITLFAAIIIGYLIRRIYKNRAVIISIELEKNKQELADFTKQLIEKSNAQEALRNELEELKSEFGEKQSIKNLQELTTTRILTKEDWYIFRKKFITVYPNFFSTIKDKGYELTKSEERLVAMEKLGLDTNQIANMLAISEDSVMMSRYRLRKKINAPKGAPILEYLKAS